MKKYSKIFLLSLISIMLVSGVCLGKTAMIDTAEGYLISNTEFINYLTRINVILIITEVIICVVCSSNIMMAKSIIKEANANNNNSNEDKIDIKNEQEKNIKKNKLYMLLSIFFINIVITIYLGIKQELFILCIPLILYILSAAFYKIEKSKRKYIGIYIVSILILFIIIVWDFNYKKNVENYNNQFLAYIGGYDTENYYISDTISLINVAIEKNSESKKQITIIYENNSYTSKEELKELINLVDKNIYQRNSREFNCLAKMDYEKYEYINSITLIDYVIEESDD